jgi:hypothetical protein
LLSKNKYARAYVELTAFWGDSTAQSTIKVSPRRWELIKQGSKYLRPAWSYYEGRRYSVLWSVADGKVTIDGEDYRQHIVEEPVSELIIQSFPSKKL